MTRLLVVATCAIAAALPHPNATAAKGPPLICFPIDIGKAASLPFGADAFGAKEDYDLKKLEADVLNLLSDDAPTLVRMETIRRATVYVGGIGGATKPDRRRAAELLNKVLARAIDRNVMTKKAGVDALFDAAYMSACFKQADLPADFGGYDWLRRALLMTDKNADYEFAAALMSQHSREMGGPDLRKEFETHLKRAWAFAAPDSLTKRNLDARFAEKPTDAGGGK